MILTLIRHLSQRRNRSRLSLLHSITQRVNGMFPLSCTYKPSKNGVASANFNKSEGIIYKEKTAFNTKFWKLIGNLN